MPGIVKLCGLRTPENALAAADAGADFIGLVFAPSPRRVTLDEAVEVCRAVRALPGGPRVVGVFVDPAFQELVAIAAALELDAVQLHGDEPPEMVRALGCSVLKAIRVRPGESVEAVERRIAPYFDGDPVPFAFLLDTYHPRAAGGTGHVFDWSIAATLARDYPIVLAGGLRPDNVAQAIEIVRPFGVDVSSGIEVAGRKDPQAMRAFVAAARAAFASVHGVSATEGGGKR